MTYDIKLQFYNGVNQISLNDNLTLFDLADGGYIPGTFVYSRFTGVGTGGSILSSGSDGIIGFVEPETGGRLVTFSNQDLFREALYQNPGDGDLGRLLFNSLNYLAGYPRSVDSDQRVNILNLGETMTGYAYKYKNARQFEHSPHNGHSVKITSFNWEKPSRDIGALNGANILLDAIGPEANWSESVDLVIIDTSATKEQLDVITEWMQRTDGGVLVALNSSIIKDTLSEFLTYYGLAVSPSSGPPIDVYTPDKILGTSGLIETYGNTSPIIDNKTINLLEEFVHVPYSELALTEEAAAQAAALFLRIKTASGENLNGLEYIELEQATSLVNLAEILSTTINAHLPDQYSISVTYDETRNVIQLGQIDTGGEDLTFSDFVLAKQAEREPTDLGQLISVFNGTFSNNPGTAVASTATWSIPVEQKDIVTRINLSLRDSHGTEFNFRDFPLYRYGNIDIGDVDDRFYNISFDEVLDASGSNYLITVTDTLGRDIVDFSLMDLSSYDPLMHAVVEDGDATGNIKLGAISGKIDATDPEGKQITYNLVGKPSFGSVVIDNNTGNYVYVPDPDVFNGYDQFHITVSDGLNESGPAALQIISETQYIESNPSIVEIAFDDPYYEERLADYSVPIPNDFTLEDVFFAQVHVQRPNDPYLALTSDRWVQLKFNATSVSSSAAPEFEVAVYDINGKKLGQRLFSGPELLPAEVDLPSDHNLADLDRGHRLDDSYVVPIPGNWVQPGVTFQLIINGEPYSLGSLNYGLQREAEGILSPKVGGGAIINLSMEHYGLGAGKDLITLEGGLTSIGEELLAKTTFAGIRLFNFPGETLEKAIQDNDLYGSDSNLRAYQLFTGDKDNLPGSDTNLDWNGFSGSLSWALDNSRKFKYANFLADGSAENPWYVNTSVDSFEGGGLGSMGGQVGGGDATFTTSVHEAIGHGTNITHIADDASFPYNSGVSDEINFSITDTMSNGETASYQQNGMIGSDWGFDQANGRYLPNYVKSKGIIGISTSPMAGSLGKLDDYQAAQFSDWEVSQKILVHAEKTIQWKPNSVAGEDTEDGGFAGVGYFSVFVLPKNDFTVEEITGIQGDTRRISSAEIIQLTDQPETTQVSVYDDNYRISLSTPSSFFSVEATLDDGSVETIKLKKEWVVLTSENSFSFSESLLPHSFNQDVYYVTAELYDVEGNNLSLNAIPAPDIALRVRKSIGDLPGEYYDVVEGTGKIFWDSNYVLRVTYVTENGFETDHLGVPSNVLNGGGSLFGMNIPNKGELARVDLVRATGVESYLQNETVATMVKPTELINTVFSHSGWMVFENKLVLPTHFNGGTVHWSTSQDGLVEMTTGSIDTSSLDDLSFLRADIDFPNNTETYYFKLAQSKIADFEFSTQRKQLSIANEFKLALEENIAVVETDNSREAITTTNGGLQGYVLVGVANYDLAGDESLLEAATILPFFTNSLYYDENGALKKKESFSPEFHYSDSINSLLKGVSPDSASTIVLTGTLTPKASGSYTFNIFGDDAVKLIIETDEGQESKVSKWWYTDQGGRNLDVSLTANKGYEIRILYEDAGAGANYFNVTWKTPDSDTFEPIPSQVLSGPRYVDLDVSSYFGNTILPTQTFTWHHKGTEGDDFLKGTSDNDILIGGTGSDIFAFRPDFGKDIVMDYEADNDIFEFYDANDAYLTSNHIQETKNADGNVILSLSDGSSVTLNGIESYFQTKAISVFTRSEGKLKEVAVKSDKGEVGTAIGNGLYEMKLGGLRHDVEGALDFSNTANTKPITSQDALDALKISVGLSTSAGTKNAFDFMSADFNQDGKVSSQDALSILKYSVGLPTSEQAKWVFVDTNGDYSGVSKSNTGYTEGISIADLSADTTVSLTGILIGDVNDSYSGLIA